jgi:hypothetical protein
MMAKTSATTIAGPSPATGLSSTRRRWDRVVLVSILSPSCRVYSFYFGFEVFLTICRQIRRNKVIHKQRQQILGKR